MTGKYKLHAHREGDRKGTPDVARRLGLCYPSFYPQIALQRFNCRKGVEVNATCREKLLQVVSKG